MNALRSFSRAPSRVPLRALALVDPIVVTIAIALASIPSEWLRSFAAPASANLAHVAFYLFWSVSRLGRSARVE